MAVLTACSSCRVVLLNPDVVPSESGQYVIRCPHCGGPSLGIRIPIPEPMPPAAVAKPAPAKGR